MEISPVAEVRIAPIIRPKEAYLGLTDVFGIERTSRTGDETYSPSGTKAATGYEDDEDKYDELQDDAEAELSVQPVGNVQINRFA